MRFRLNFDRPRNEHGAHFVERIEASTDEQAIAEALARAARFQSVEPRSLGATLTREHLGYEPDALLGRPIGAIDMSGDEPRWFVDRCFTVLDGVWGVDGLESQWVIHETDTYDEAKTFRDARGDGLLLIEERVRRGGGDYDAHTSPDLARSTPSCTVSARS